ncbi:MAG: hypothetical protein M3021_09235 [Actinomycetota bacterium]|nr:hypothetical protein [Actinomycetota bacterium]
MSLHITTVRGYLREERAQQQLLRRLAAYDLRTWQLTAMVQIQTMVIPQRSAVLTLTTRFLADDQWALATYLRE